MPSKKAKKEEVEPSTYELTKEKENDLKKLKNYLGDLNGELIGVKMLNVPEIVKAIEDHIEEIKDNIKELEELISGMQGPMEMLKLKETERAELEKERTQFEIELHKVRPAGFKAISKYIESVIDGIREDQEENEAEIETLKQGQTLSSSSSSSS